MENIIRNILTIEDGVSVYENADISIQDFRPDEVYPSALYVLRPHIEKIRCIGSELWRRGVNIFQLDDVINMDEIMIAPPVIEMSDGVPTIVDGIHRFYLARQLGFDVRCVFINGASLPLISYPVEWQDVRMYDEPPQQPELRRRIREGISDTSTDLRKYYRDLSVLGSKGRRPRKDQNG